MALIGLLIPLAIAGDAAAQETASASVGDICVMAIEKASSGEQSLANPAGGGRVFEYTVQVDDRKPSSVSFERNVLLADLATSRRHLVVIRNQGRRVSSFWFDFESAGDRRLCLWFKELYETWSLSPAKHLGGRCGCGASGQ